MARGGRMPLWTVNKPIEKNNIISYTEEFRSPLLEARNGSYTNQSVGIRRPDKRIIGNVLEVGKDSKGIETSSKNEILEDRLDYLEEELEAEKIQNIKVKNHLNSTIKQLNSLTLWVKRHFNHVPRIETTYEVDT